MSPSPSEIPNVIRTIIDDRSRALYACHEDMADADPDDEHRTAIRYLGASPIDDTRKFQVVRTTEASFGGITDSVGIHYQLEIVEWVTHVDPTVIAVSDEAGFEPTRYDDSFPPRGSYPRTSTQSANPSP